MKKIISLFLTAVIAVACLSFTACNKNDFSYWQVNGVRIDDETRMKNIAELSCSSTKITQVWINVSDLKPEKTNISIDIYSSSTTTTAFKKINHTVTRSDIKAAQKKEGWINVFTGETERSAVKIVVTATDEFRFNEIVAINTDKELIKLTFSKGGVMVGENGDLYTKDQLDKLTEENPAYNKNPAYNIVDEQDKFPMEYVEQN